LPYFGFNHFTPPPRSFLKESRRDASLQNRIDAPYLNGETHYQTIQWAFEFRSQVGSSSPAEESTEGLTASTSTRFRLIEAKLTRSENGPKSDDKAEIAEPDPKFILGVAVAPENRCAPYSRDQYAYSQTLEPQIVAQQHGYMFSPYNGQFFYDLSESDIDHIVALSEAHDSGLCAASQETKWAFANDLLNLTLANPQLNQQQKRNYDLAEWLPIMNVCWYADRVVEVKKKYHLTMDLAEATKAKEILDSCISTALSIPRRAEVGTSPSPTTTRDGIHPLELYGDNGNGRITCAEARAHGIAPVPTTHPAYKYMRDGDGDGWVCE